MSIALGIALGVPGLRTGGVSYRSSWLHTIYVATTGNDTTGTGSQAAPYLTLTKAMTVAVAGDGILLGNGTYAENTGGNNYWQINNKNYADWLTIEPDLGEAGDVTILGAANAVYNTIIQGTSGKIHFKWLKFSAYAGSRYPFYIGGNVSNIKLTDCQTLGVDNTWTGISIQGAGYTVSNLTFTNLTVNKPATGATFQGVDIDGHITNYSNIAFIDCAIDAIYDGFNVGACGSLTITGGSITSVGSAGAVGLRLAGVSGFVASGCTITSTNGSAISSENANNVASLTSCTIIGKANGIALSTGTNTITMDTCTITVSAGIGINFGTAVFATTANFTNLTVTSSGSAFVSNGVTGIVITGGTYQVTGNGFGMIFGADGEAGNTTTVTVTNATVIHNIATTGHSVLFGAGCTSCIANGVVIQSSYDYGLVIKENTGTEVENCTIAAGNTAGLCFKGAISANAHNNTITATAGKGFWLIPGTTGNKCSTWQLQNNVINVSGTGKALTIGGDAADLGGGICDYNQYQSNSGLGEVRSDADVQNLTELMAAWADYDVTTNDSHSTVV